MPRGYKIAIYKMKMNIVGRKGGLNNIFSTAMSTRIFCSILNNKYVP